MVKQLKIIILIVLSIYSVLSLEEILIEKNGYWTKSPLGINYIVTMKTTERALTPEMAAMSRGDRLTAYAEALKKIAANSQKNVLEMLTTEQLTRTNLTFETFWISNQLIVHGADALILEKIQKMDKVANISPETVYKFSPIKSSRQECQPKPMTAWGVDKIKAPEVWTAQINGTGVIVANIDTGVQWTHEALRCGYVGSENYGWFDPQSYTESPTDLNGHGTHTMGSMAGRGGIGVAHGSKWMACQGCDPLGICYTEKLIKCFEFLLCPTSTNGTNPNCSKAPHVINNSWGGGPKGAFDMILEIFQKMDIPVIFAVGNAGPECQTTHDPGDSKFVIGVGATTIEDDLAYFSSSGPGPIKGSELKPDIVAPGFNIPSSFIGESNNCYANNSGTSMASPHIAGVVALMLSKNPRLTIPEIRRILFESSEKIVMADSRNCWGIPDVSCPNYSFGHGRINALTAINKIPSPPC